MTLLCSSASDINIKIIFQPPHDDNQDVECGEISEQETVLLCLMGGVLVLMWMFVIWIFIFTVKEARRQKMNKMKKEEKQHNDGGVALVLARELQDKYGTIFRKFFLMVFLLSLYLTDSMLFDHATFRSQYERIPDDYPDAFTINRVKLLEENRWSLIPFLKSMRLKNKFRLVDYFSENREVDYLIKNMFRR